MPRIISTVLALSLVAAGALVAQEKKKEADDAFGDLFGDTLSGTKKSKMGELEEAAGGVKSGGGDQGLTPKGESREGEEGIQFIDQFAAEQIIVTKQEGCVPADRARTRLTFFEFGDVPAKSPKLSLCLKMSSRVNRQVRVTASILNPRLKRVARAESVVSFQNVTRADHVLDYPAMPLDMTGPYVVQIDVDGKPTTKLPLFEVRLAQ